MPEVSAPSLARALTRILVCIEEREQSAFFPDAGLSGLLECSATVAVTTPQCLDDEELAEIEILVVAWRFPRLDADLLARMPRLRLVVNAASSVRRLVSEAFWASDIPISQSGDAMSPAVGEMSLALTLSLLRRTHRMDHALRTNTSWTQARAIPRAREIAGARIGVLGASRTGREYVRMCRALGADVRIYDPYLAPDDPLATHTVSLQKLFRGSDVVALHAPATPQTEGLVTRELLASMPDGSLFVNTARSSLVDMDALYDEVSDGRLDAALDVFDSEPLPENDRWRSLPNALLTGHVSGATRESRARAGRIVAAEIERFLSGLPLQHRVTEEALERMG